MSKNQKDKGKGLEQFLRYQQDGLRDEERHAIERETERDPFAAEAMEGLSSITPEEARADLATLRRMLKKRTTGRSFRIWYAAAASVAILAVIGTLYFTVFSEQISNLGPGIAESTEEAKADKKEKGSSQNTESDSDEVIESEARRLTDQSDNEIERFQAESPVAAGSATEREIQPPSPESSTASGRLDAESSIEETGSAIEEEIEEEDPNLQGNSEIMQYAESQEPLDDELLAGREASGSDPVTSPQETEDLSLADISFEEDLSEEIASAPTTAKSAARSTLELTAVSDQPAEELTGDLPSDSQADPVGGMEAYLVYIRDNLQFPQADSSLTSARVRLSFLLNEAGRPSDIRIEESPGELFSQEAIRLIENGPAWQPALSSEGLSQERIYFTVSFDR